MVDAGVMARVNAIQGYTVLEHYTVYRGADEVHPLAEMTVRTTYTRETGKNYEILSESGSAIARKFVFAPLLENEKAINLPAAVHESWLISANYDMKIQPGGPRQIDGRACIGIAINPKRKAPNLVEGTLWVDQNDGAIVRVEGVSSKSPSLFTGATHMMRQYGNVNGFPMAYHARAESDSFFVGHVVLTIDYHDYKIRLRPGL
jgi:hypothetical protein